MELKEFEHLYQMIEQHKTLDETSEELYADLKKAHTDMPTCGISSVRWNGRKRGTMMSAGQQCTIVL